MPLPETMLEIVVTATLIISVTNAVFVWRLYKTRADKAYCEKEFDKLHEQIANISK